MVDEFTEEINLRLIEGGRPARGAAPTILVGLGDFGRACLKNLRDDLDLGVKPSAFLSIKADADVPVGISFLTDNEQACALTPGTGGTRAAIYVDAVSNSRSLERWIKETAAKLLNADGAGGHIRVAFFADAEEVGASALTVAAAESARAALSGFISNWSVCLDGFILLPKGRSAVEAQVYALLKELSGGDGSRSPTAPAVVSGVRGSLYDRVFVVTEANAGGLVGRAGSIELVSEFAGLMMEADFADAVAQVFDITGATFAGFGIASVVHPTNRIIADESARFAGELINSGLMGDSGLMGGGGGEPFYRLADEYLKAERLDVAHLRDRLMADAEGRVVDRVDIDSLSLAGLPLEFWPDRIASYNAFLAQDKVPGLIDKLEDNLTALSAEVSAGLRAKMDELIYEPSALEKTGHFIGRMAEKADELRALAERKKQEIAGRSPDMGSLHQDLVSRIQNLPGSAAVIGRALLMSVLLYFFTLKFMFVLARFPDVYLDPGYLPAALPTAGAAAIAVVSFSLLLYKRAENGLFRARDRYLEAVGDKYRFLINEHALRLLGWWLGGKDEEALSERRVRSFADAISEEKSAVLRLNRLYLEINDQLKAGATGGRIETRIRRSVYSAFGQTAELRYKKGRYNLVDEAEYFTGFGHVDWRRLELSELKRRLREYCGRGLEFIDNRSLDRLFLEFGESGQDMTAVVADLKRSSQPYIAISTGLPRTTELLGVFGGSESALASHPAIVGQAAIVPIWSPHRMAFAQLVCLAAIERLSSYERWRQAYELAPNKGDIDCVAGFGRREVA